MPHSESYSFFSVRKPGFFFDKLCRDCAIELSTREREFGVVTNNALTKIAQEVTDSVMGQGSYARVNGLVQPLVIQEEPDGHDL
jgi:hypothetical protein